MSGVGPRGRAGWGAGFLPAGGGWRAKVEPVKRTGFVERRGRIKDLDRSFDLAFWREQTPQARFDAAWELIVHASKVKGVDVRQLRLQRSIETFQRAWR